MLSIIIKTHLFRYVIPTSEFMTDAMIWRTKSPQEFIQQYMLYFYHLLFVFVDVWKSSSVHPFIHKGHEYPLILRISPCLGTLGWKWNSNEEREGYKRHSSLSCYNFQIFYFFQEEVSIPFSSYNLEIT